MRFLLDESADYPLGAHLTQLGHDVTAIAHDYPQAMKDWNVLAQANEEQRILITNDRDFGELVVRQRLPHCGVIFFRLAEESIPTKIKWLNHVLANYTEHLQRQRFLVITSRGVRVRQVTRTP